MCLKVTENISKKNANIPMKEGTLDSYGSYICTWNINIYCGIYGVMAKVWSNDLNVDGSIPHLYHL